MPLVPHNAMKGKLAVQYEDDMAYKKHLLVHL
jgi:hypothetical protein